MARKRAVEFLDALLREKRLDAILLTELANISYLTGFSGSEAVVIYSKGTRWFLTDFRYQEQAKEEVLGFKLQIFKNKLKALSRVAAMMGLKSMGFEASAINFAFYRALRKELKTVRLVPLEKSLLEIRAVKETDEIQNLKKAVRISETALNRALQNFRAGISELELAAELEFQLRRAGSGWFAFETIVASGHRAALPHAKSSAKKIQKGEMVIIDFGASCKGYAADLTVTVAAGEPGKKARIIYEAVSNAQKAAIAGVREGALCREIDALARNYLKARGYGRYFGHGLGHGLGLAVHEEPSLNPRSGTVLKPGMVFTIEPGIYLPGELGVRIEDDLLLNQGKNVLVLSRSNQPLRIFE